MFIGWAHLKVRAVNSARPYSLLFDFSSAGHSRSRRINSPLRSSSQFSADSDAGVACLVRSIVVGYLPTVFDAYITQPHKKTSEQKLRTALNQIFAHLSSGFSDDGK